MNKKILVFILSIFLLFSCSKTQNSNTLTQSGIDLGTTSSQTGTTNHSKRGELIEKMIIDGDLEKAESVIKTEYKKDEKNVDILRIYAKLNSSQKKYDEALKYITKANELTDYKNKQLLYDLGVIYSALGNTKDAEKYISESLEIDPDYKFAKDYLNFLKNGSKGVISGTGGTYSFNGSQIETLIDEKKYTDADKILQSEYKKDNKNSEILRLLGRLNSVQKKYDDSLKYILEANKITDYKNKQLLYDLGVIYSALGNSKDAEKYINESLKIDPDYKFAKDYLNLLKTTQNESK